MQVVGLQQQQGYFIAPKKQYQNMSRVLDMLRVKIFCNNFLY